MMYVYSLLEWENMKEYLRREAGANYKRFFMPINGIQPNTVDF